MITYSCTHVCSIGLASKGSCFSAKPLILVMFIRMNARHGSSPAKCERMSTHTLLAKWRRRSTIYISVPPQSKGYGQMWAHMKQVETWISKKSPKCWKKREKLNYTIMCNKWSVTLATGLWVLFTKMNRYGHVEIRILPKIIHFSLFQFLLVKTF